MLTQNTRGFTLLEILIAVAVLAILAALTAVALQNFNRAASLRVASQDVRTSLIDTRNSTLASDGDTVFGVHIGETEVVRFVGGTYNSGDPSNEIYPFGSEVTATTSLSAGSSEIIFERLTGIPSATGKIWLRNGRSTTTITIHQTGLVE